MSPIRLIFLPRDPDAPILYRVVEDGRTAERGALTPGLPAPHADFPAVVVVPGEDVVCRWLALPAGRDVQAAAAAGFLLDDQLAGPRDAMHIAVGPPEADGQRLAAVVDRVRMGAWLDLVAAVAVSPLALVPDHLLLAEPEGEGTLAVRLTDGAYAVRGRRLALTCDAELLRTVAGPDRHVVDDPVEGERLMAAGAGAALFDLRQGAFAPLSARSDRRLNWLALVAALVALSIPAIPAVEAFRHHMAAERASGRSEALAGPATPGAPAADAVARLRARLDRQQAAERFSVAAAAVFAGVQRVEGMELQELLYGEDGALRINVAHPNYSDIELFRAALARSGLAVEESSTMTEGGRIVSDLVVRPQP
jgi:general secretion pathway protein L